MYFVRNKFENSSKFQRIKIVTSILIPMFIFSIFLSHNTSAASLTLSIPSTPLSITLNPTTDSGFAKSSNGTVTMTTTGANWGYKLTIKSKDGKTNALKNGSNSIASITTDINENTFKSGTTYDNKWGYLPSKFNSQANTNYKAGPTAEATIDNTTSQASPANYTFSIAAKANSSLPTGNYSNTFVLTSTANTASYTINYNLNSGTWSGKTPQTGSTTETSVKLDSNTPTREGYEFKGWCTAATTNESCSGTTYQPGASYALKSGSSNVTRS